MSAKIIIALLGFINGGWMLFDGAHVLFTGRYFGPEKPGPWADLVSSIGLDPMQFGAFFTLFGLIWITGTIAIIMNRHWSLELLIGIAFFTIWYLPFGTIISVIVIALLLKYKNRIYE